MTHVKLMGEIGDKFGAEWDMNVSNFRDMLRLIDCQTEGFKEYLTDCAKKGIDFTIQNGEDLVEGTVDAMIAPPKNIVIITPVAAGAGASDVFKVILGAILIYYGAGFVDGLFAESTAAAEAQVVAANSSFSGSQIKATEAAAELKKIQTMNAVATRAVQVVGTTLGMSGVTGYLTPESPSEAGKSYLYDGPENNTLQGAPVPLLYGRLLVGGSVINFGFVEDQILYNQSGYTTIKSNYHANSPYNSATGSTVVKDNSVGQSQEK
jgi:predicted phage tail protein